MRWFRFCCLIVAALLGTLHGQTFRPCCVALKKSVCKWKELQWTTAHQPGKLYIRCTAKNTVRSEDNEISNVGSQNNRVVISVEQLQRKEVKRIHAECHSKYCRSNHIQDVIVYKDPGLERCLIEYLWDDNWRDLQYQIVTAHITPSHVRKTYGHKVERFCRHLKYGTLQRIIQPLTLAQPPTEEERQWVVRSILEGRQRYKREASSRFRGQTQTQFTSFGNGNGSADALSKPGLSTATVHGANGMGSAQSQSGGGDCDEECLVSRGYGPSAESGIPGTKTMYDSSGRPIDGSVGRPGPLPSDPRFGAPGLDGAVQRPGIEPSYGPQGPSSGPQGPGTRVQSYSPNVSVGGRPSSYGWKSDTGGQGDGGAGIYDPKSQIPGGADTASRGVEPTHWPQRPGAGVLQYDPHAPKAGVPSYDTRRPDVGVPTIGQHVPGTGADYGPHGPFYGSQGPRGPGTEGQSYGPHVPVGPQHASRPSGLPSCTPGQPCDETVTNLHQSPGALTPLIPGTGGQGIGGAGIYDPKSQIPGGAATGSRGFEPTHWPQRPGAGVLQYDPHAPKAGVPSYDTRRPDVGVPTIGQHVPGTGADYGPHGTSYGSQDPRVPGTVGQPYDPRVPVGGRPSSYGPHPASRPSGMPSCTPGQPCDETVTNLHQSPGALTPLIPGTGGQGIGGAGIYDPQSQIPGGADTGSRGYEPTYWPQRPGAGVLQYDPHAPKAGVPSYDTRRPDVGVPTIGQHVPGTGADYGPHGTSYGSQDPRVSGTVGQSYDPRVPVGGRPSSYEPQLGSRPSGTPSCTPGQPCDETVTNLHQSPGALTPLIPGTGGQGIGGAGIYDPKSQIPGGAATGSRGFEPTHWPQRPGAGVLQYDPHAPKAGVPSYDTRRPDVGVPTIGQHVPGTGADYGPHGTSYGSQDPRVSGTVGQPYDPRVPVGGRPSSYGPQPASRPSGMPFCTPGQPCDETVTNLNQSPGALTPLIPGTGGQGIGGAGIYDPKSQIPGGAATGSRGFEPTHWPQRPGAGVLQYDPHAPKAGVPSYDTRRPDVGVPTIGQHVPGTGADYGPHGTSYGSQDPRVSGTVGQPYDPRVPVGGRPSSYGPQSASRPSGMPSCTPGQPCDETVTNLHQSPGALTPLIPGTGGQGIGGAGIYDPKSQIPGGADTGSRGYEPTHWPQRPGAGVLQYDPHAPKAGVPSYDTRRPDVGVPTIGQHVPGTGADYGPHGTFYGSQDPRVSGTVGQSYDPRVPVGGRPSSYGPQLGSRPSGMPSCTPGQPCDETVTNLQHSPGGSTSLIPGTGGQGVGSPGFKDPKSEIPGGADRSSYGPQLHSSRGPGHGPPCIPGLPCDDTEDSQVQTSVHQEGNNTRALSSAQGRFGSGIAQAQVSGLYSGTGSFQAQAQTSDSNKGAQVQVIGGSRGASSSAQGMGGKGKTQAQVQLGSQTGASTAEAQSGGFNFGTNTQVQAGMQGGLADAQADGPGSTSSQAQIGFTPYHRKTDQQRQQRVPFEGGVKATAQSGKTTGQSQTEVFGSFFEGISYSGSAQAGSGAGTAKVRSNSTNANETERESLTHMGSTLPQFGEGILKNRSIFEDNHSIENFHDPTKDKPEETKHDGNFSRAADPRIDKDAEILEGGERKDLEYDDLKEEDSGEEDFSDGARLRTKPIRLEAGKGITSSHGTVVEKKEGITVGQRGPNQSQAMFVGSIDDKHDVHIEQGSNGVIREGDVLEAGERILGPNGYTIPPGYRGRVTSVTGDVAKARMSNGHAQTQSVIVKPGTGRILYRNLKPTQQTYSPQHGRYSTDPHDFVTVTRSETGRIANDKESLSGASDSKKYSHTYYTKSSTCGYFTFTCNVVFGSNGRAKICKPNPPTNADGSPCTP